MKLFFLWAYPATYLRYFHAKRPDLAPLSYEAHRTAILDDHFAWSGELSRFLSRQGITVEFVIPNAASVQRKWAAENGYRAFSEAGWEKEIALEQIRRAKPDVLWISSMFDYYGAFIQASLQYARRVIVWVGEPWPAPDVRGISVLITENPNTFREVQHCFQRVIVTKPGFSPDILRDLGHVERKGDIVFSGQIMKVHRRRAETLAFLVRNGVPVQLHCLSDEDLTPGRWEGILRALWLVRERHDSAAARATLKRAFRPSAFERNMDLIQRLTQPPVFGMDMYRALAGSRMVLNIHADIVSTHAGNNRMFEATGVGSCLITEDMPNIRELFDPGAEVLSYRSADDLLRLLRWGLAHKEEVERIACAGQKRTLQSHTLERMYEDIRPALQ